MDIGDWIFPILIIGGAIVQWLTSRKEQEPPPEEVDDLPDLEELLREEDKKASSSQEPSWPEPMEDPVPRPPVITPAPKRVEPVRTPAVPAPAPQVVPEVRMPSEEELKKEVRKSLRELRVEKAAARRPIGSMKRQTLSAGPIATARAKELLTALRDQTSVRKAIVLNEVLQKPVAFRD